MKKTIVIASCLLAGLLSSAAIADDNNTAVSQNNTPVVEWTSANSDDKITIQNGSGAKLSIQITVNGDQDAPGITVQNCGDTTTIKAGSSAICVTDDPNNPVTLFSDNQSLAAKGTYQVTTQPDQAPQVATPVVIPTP